MATELVPVSKVVVDKGFNNRRSLGDLAELAASIKSIGLLEPILVRRENGSLHVIAGERRLAATKPAGKREIEVKVVDLEEAARLEALLVENLHRKDIDPLEEADGYRRLTDLDLKQAEIAKKVGRSEAHVSKRLALIGLSPLASKLVSAGTIPIDAAIALAKHQPAHQDKAIEAVKKMYRDLGNAAPYQLRALGRRAADEAKKAAMSKKRAEMKKKLRDEGVAIVSGAQSYSWGQPGKPWRVGGKPKNSGYSDARHVDMTPKQHSEFSCHAAAITGGDMWTPPGVVYLCTDPKAHMSKEQAAALERKKKADVQDSYEAKRRRAQALVKEIKAAQESRLLATREALRSTDQQALVALALESFVMSTNFEALAELLGLPAGKAAKAQSVEDYCNASHANLVRAAAAAAIRIGENAIEHIAESQAGGYYADSARLPQAVAVREWFKNVGIELTEPELKALEKAAKK